ncbi:MAG: ABC transporter permease [Bauldia sp.]
MSEAILLKESASTARPRNLRMRIALGVIAAYLLMAIIGPLIVPYDAVSTDIGNRLLPPLAVTSDGVTALLGTDALGRDLVAQIIQGARISIEVGFATLVLAGSIGLIVGVAAGYFGGRLDAVLMRVADIQLAFPAILLAIYIASIFGPGVSNVILVLAIANWVVFARVTRAQTIATLQLEFVQATRSLGAGHWHTIRHCILPACMASLIIISTVELGAVIVSEASLSFLGLGTPPNSPSWGLTIANGRNYLASAWWISTFPGIALGILVIAVGILGDELRDRLDPNLKTK